MFASKNASEISIDFWMHFGSQKGAFLELFVDLPWHGVFRLHLESFLLDFLAVSSMEVYRAKTAHPQILS